MFDQKAVLTLEKLSGSDEDCREATRIILLGGNPQLMYSSLLLD
jgi:hypothetical protein